MSFYECSRCGGAVGLFCTCPNKAENTPIIQTPIKAWMGNNHLGFSQVAGQMDTPLVAYADLLVAQERVAELEVNLKTANANSKALQQQLDKLKIAVEGPPNLEPTNQEIWSRSQGKRL